MSTMRRAFASLRFQMLALISAASVLFGLIIVFYAPYQARDSARDILLDDARFIAKLLADNLTLCMISRAFDDGAALRQTLDLLRSGEGADKKTIEQTLVFDDNRRLVAALFPASKDTASNAAFDRLDSLEIFDNAALVVARAPMKKENRTFGYVEIRFSKTSFLNKAQKTVWTSLLVGGVSFLIITLIAGSLLSRSFIQPVRALMEQTRSIAEGNLSQSIRVRSRNEIGALARSISGMAVQLENNIERLDAAVVERTRELQVSNRDLTRTLTELKVAQKQLVESEKMAALGELVAGVAQELNTPLGVALTAAGTLEREAKEFVEFLVSGKTLKKSDLTDFAMGAATGAEMTLRNVRRAAQIIQSFKQVAMDQTSDARRFFRLGAYLQEIATTLRPVLKTGNHRVEIECADTLEIESYPGALAQVVAILIQNSVQHGFEGFAEEGSIRIACRLEGDWIEIEYSDTGRGIAPDVSPSIFDSPFAADSSKGGAGLGLHLAYDLITRKLRGDMRYESAESAGAAFRLRLPLYDA